MGYLAAMTRYFPTSNSQKDHLLIFRVRLALLLMWASALALLSLASDVKTPSGLLGWDKFNHFAAYAVLALLLIRFLAASDKTSIRWLVVSWLACAAYGLLLESLQWLMGIGRQWELGDLLANALGALSACVIFRHIAGRISKSNDQ